MAKGRKPVTKKAKSASFFDEDFKSEFFDGDDIDESVMAAQSPFFDVNSDSEDMDDLLEEYGY